MRSEDELSFEVLSAQGLTPIFNLEETIKESASRSTSGKYWYLLMDLLLLLFHNFYFCSFFYSCFLSIPFLPSTIFPRIRYSTIAGSKLAVYILQLQRYRGDKVEKRDNPTVVHNQIIR